MRRVSYNIGSGGRKRVFSWHVMATESVCYLGEKSMCKSHRPGTLVL